MGRRALLALVAALTVVTHAQDSPAPGGDPYPKTIDELKAAVQKVLDDTGVPGVGLALVRLDGVEWAGGIGYADRDLKTPVTADTHFRAGSISKTFIAAALVQLSEDGDINLDNEVSTLAPEIAIDNAWELTDPVRVIHLLEHTAGFDDMHFNEVYNREDPADMPLVDALRVNPRSRVVRWRPGTRMSYSNPGYAVAGYILEKVTGEKFEDRIAEHIFKPTGMENSSFHLTADDYPKLSKGYADRVGPPVPYSPIYLRPAGNLHTTSADLGKFVHLLLNWGETKEDLVVDPEYLSNMEHPRTTIASAAGLQGGYGSGIVSLAIEGFPMLGHSGGIEGFSSLYAYSTSRDVGLVVLMNATFSGDARRRISNLAVRYLKAGIEPPAKPEAATAEAVLRQFEGYYHPAAFRNQSYAFLEWLLTGRAVSVSGKRLKATSLLGSAVELIPVSDNLFRLEAEPEATSVFTRDGDGDMVWAGGLSYDEQRPRWQVEIVRLPVLASAAFVLTPVVMLLPWIVHARRAEPSGFWWLKLWLLGCSVGFLLPVAGIMNVDPPTLGTRNIWTVAMFIGTLLFPAAAVLSLLFTIDAFVKGAGRWLRNYALVVSIGALIISAYLSAWGMIGFRPWSY
ncbi:MAG TPA: serine hydrolase domain-containing protein [Vicinamibacterales bacterium]|nr:serine hydrolase domain-containing protein [Vicinamibacterales bacterium]